MDVAVELAPGADRLEVARRLSEALGLEVDVVPLRDAPVLLLEEVLRDGHPLVEATPGSMASWLSRAQLVVDLDGPRVRQTHAALRRRLAADG